MPLDVQATVMALAWMLLGGAILAAFAWRLRVPYAVILVLGALVAEETHLVSLPQLDPPVLLFVFLPPLLFDAAFRLDVKELRSVAHAVVWLSVPGTIATAAMVALVMVWLLGMPLAPALVFGSIVAATDPVAVVSVFRRVNAPINLAVIAEAESLVNDGVAITLYAASVGLLSAPSLDVFGALGLFAREVVGGIAIGAVLGVLSSRLTAAIDDHLVEMTFSTALAYGSYFGGAIARYVRCAGLRRGGPVARQLRPRGWNERAHAAPSR